MLNVYQVLQEALPSVAIFSSFSSQKMDYYHSSNWKDPAVVLFFSWNQVVVTSKLTFIIVLFTRFSSAAFKELALRSLGGQSSLYIFNCYVFVFSLT